jgi:methylase of polypeptide subunit release factors
MGQGQGGFDIIIGNPPYVALQNTKIEELVKRMMSNPKDEETQKQIDLEVCKAYGLDDSETQYVLSQS